jgi:hypothetical protein
MKKWILTLVILGAGIGGFAQKDSVAHRQQRRVDIRLNKGNVMVGGTIGLNSRNIGNQNQLIRKVDIEDMFSFNVRVDGAYAIKDDVFVGLGVEYAQTNRTGDYINPDDGTTSHVQYFANSYSFKPFIKNHLALDPIGRFNLINQTELQVNIQQSLTETTADNVVTRTLNTSQVYGIGVRPGLQVFVINNFAFEATVNLAGINYTRSRIETTNLPAETVTKGSIDFKIDILQVNLGFLIYL